MNRDRLIASLCVLVAAGAILYRGESPAPAADPVKQDSTELRYAKARLKAAELRLESAKELNRRVRGTLSDAIMAEFITDVEFGKLQVQAASEAKQVDSFQFWIKRIEMAVSLAEENLRRMQAANRAGGVNKSDLERAQLNLDIAQLRLELTNSMADAKPEARLKWQLEMLGDELAQVKEQTGLLGQNRLAQFY